VTIPCPQCGGDVRLQDTSGFVGCPYCRTSLVLDLSGVRPHLMYRPRHEPAAVLPLVRRWCDATRLPPPRLLTSPQLVYYPFWRFIGPGRPRLVPGWPTLEARWTDYAAPEAEQVVYDPAALGGARLVEANVAETAARSGLPDTQDPRNGDLVHIPFYEVKARIGVERVSLCLDACAGRLLPDRRPGGEPRAPKTSAAVRGTAILAWLAMFLAAAAAPHGWVAAGAVALIGCLTYWLLTAQLGSDGG